MTENTEGKEFQSPFFLGKLEGRVDEQEKRLDRQDENFKEAVTTIHDRIDKKHTESMEQFSKVGKAMERITEKQDGLQKWIYGLLITGAIAIMTLELGIIKVIGSKLLNSP